MRQLLEVSDMSFPNSFANFTGHSDAAMDAVIGFYGSLVIFHNSAGAQCSDDLLKLSQVLVKCHCWIHFLCM